MFEFFDGLTGDSLDRLLERLSHKQADATRHIYELVNTSRMVMNPLELALSKHRLTLARARVLILLRAWADDHEQGLSPGQLAKLAQVRPATMTRLLDGLEQDHFIKRVIDLEDRRKLRILCTPKGVDAINEVMTDFATGAELATADFTHQEVAHLTVLMNKLKRNCEPSPAAAE